MFSFYGILQIKKRETTKRKNLERHTLNPLQMSYNEWVNE